MRAPLGGESGHEQILLVRVGKVHGSPATDALDPARNFQSAHALQRAHGLPTYELLDCEFPSDEVPYFWVATSAVEGRPLGQWLDVTIGEERASLHHFAGDTVGRVHAITRPYNGWVDQTTPYRVD